VTSLVTFAAGGETTFAWLRLPVGLVSGGAWIGQQALGVEYCAPRHRILFFLLAQIGWCSGEVWAALIAWGVSGLDWRALTLLNLMYVPAVCLVYYLPETPRFLLLRGEHEEAMATIRRIAEINRSPLGPKDVLQASGGAPPNGADAASSVGIGSSLMLTLNQLGAPSVLPRVMLISAVWIGAAGSYYGVAFTSVEFEVYNVYVTDLVMIGAEIVALPVLAWVTEYGGRRITVAATIAICSVGFFVIQAATNTAEETLELVFVCITRFSASLVASIIWLVASEIFPTSVRSLAMGVGASCGRFGCLIFPFLTDGHFAAGFATAGVIDLVCFICSLFLVEMTGNALSDVIADVAAMAKDPLTAV